MRARAGVCNLKRSMSVVLVSNGSFTQLAYPVSLDCVHACPGVPEAGILPQGRRLNMMEVVNAQMVELKKLWKNKRQLLFQSLNLAMIVFSALMIWKGLMFVTKSESPVVVVLR